MATIDYTGDYWTYSDTPINLPITTDGTLCSKIYYDYTIIDDITKENKGGKNMYTLWKVMILDPETDNFEEYKVTAKCKEIAVFKALYEHIGTGECDLAKVDELKIECELVMTYEKPKKKNKE